MKNMSEQVGMWFRGLVWTAMIFGCAWASAQSYVVSVPAQSYKFEAMNTSVRVAPEGTHVLVAPVGSYHLAAMGKGAGVEGAQNTEPASKDELFANTEVFAKNARHVTEITMDPDTLNMVGGSDEHKARSMVLNVVRSYTYDKPGMYNMADVDALRNKLNTGDWRCSIHTRDMKTGEGSDICGKKRTDGMKEQVIIEVSPTHLTFIHQIRRAGAPGTSMLGFLPALPGMEGLSSLAMLDPDLMADMRAGLPYAMSEYGPMVLTMPGAGTYTLKMPDMTELNEKLKQLKIKPFDPEQMKKFDDQRQQQFKDLSNKLRDFSDKYKAGHAPPLAPATPPPNVPQSPK